MFNNLIDRSITATLALLALVALTACDETDPTATAPELEGSHVAVLSTSGNTIVSGHVKGLVGQLGLNFEQYSFNALRKADGSVTGEWQVMDQAGVAILAHGNVTCFDIEADGKTVRLAGVLERGNAPPFTNPGFQANWTVQDNGEGANAPTDLATDLTFGFGPASVFGGQCHCTKTCQFLAPPQLNDGTGYTNILPAPIAAGNIQVNQ